MALPGEGAPAGCGLTGPVVLRERSGGTSQGGGGEGRGLPFRAVPPAGLCGAGPGLLSPALSARLCPGFSMSSAARTLRGTRYNVSVLGEVERFSPSSGALCRSGLFPRLEVIPFIFQDFAVRRCFTFWMGFDVLIEATIPF